VPMQTEQERWRSSAARRYGSTLLFICFSLGAQDYEQGVALIEKRQFDAAIPLLARAAAARPGDAQVHKALGVAHAARNDYELAEPAFGRACELDAKLLDACYYHGRALYALNRFDAALAALRRAPEGWRVSVGIGQAMEAFDRPVEAETEFRKALALCRDASPQPGVALAQFLIRQGRQGEALHPLQAVLRRYPNSGEARTLLGRVLLDRGEHLAAMEHLKQAVAIDPKSSQAHLLLANAYVKSGRPQDAKPHFAEAAQNAK
jgi:Flp pilus assembly protein TadD